MNYQTIRQIASYEIKLFSRDWSFRFITVVSVVLIALLQVLAQGNLKETVWIAISLPSAIPFANAYLVNYLQIVIIIFWSGRLVWQERRIDTNFSLETHPFSNVEYFFGKILGFIVVLLCLDLLLAIVALGINLLLSDSPFALYPYVFYFLTLTFPVLVFTTGICVCVKGIVRKSILSLLILMGLFYLEIVYAPSFYHGTIDLFSYTLSNAFSDVTGFSGLGLYLLQRLSFFLWGCGLLVLGILAITRLSNHARLRKRIMPLGMFILCIGFLSAGGYAGYFILEQGERDQFREVFLKYEKIPKVRITDHDICFEQKGILYQATSNLSIVNPEEYPLTSILFYLNPGLEITRMTIGGQPAKFSREQQVVIVDHALQPGGRENVTLQYKGTIMPEVCYPEIEDLCTRVKDRTYSIYRFGEDFFYLRPDFTLLTPECLWYPTALPTVNIVFPNTTSQSYTRFQLSVIGEQERIPISQGHVSRSGDTIRFMNSQNLTGISLCMGNYIRKAIESEGKLYEVYVFKGHEYLVEQFTNIEEILNDWNSNFSYSDKKYVFDKLAFVETPVHFCAYGRFWKKESEYLQPELIFRPEREALTARPFKVLSRALNEGVSPQMECIYNYRQNYEGTRSLFEGNILVRASLLSLSSLLSPSSLSLSAPAVLIKNESDISFLEKKNYFYVYSPEFAGINSFFQAMQNSWEIAYRSYNEYNNFTPAIRYLGEHGLEDVLQDMCDVTVYNQVLQLTGDYFLRYFLCDISFQEFQEFTRGFIDRHSFQEVRYEQYCKEFQERFGMDMIALTRQLYSFRERPSFRVRDVQIQWVEMANGERGFVQCVKVWNRGKVGGVITLAASHFQGNIHYFIPAGACQEIRNYFPGEPHQFNLEVQTNLAQNIPSRFSFRDLKPDGTVGNPHPGVFDTDTLSFTPPSGEYIVDDNDPGFHVIEDKRLLENSSSWTLDDKWEAYGEPVRELHYRRLGKGDSRVMWETILPNEGVYEVFAYNNADVIQAQSRAFVFIDGKKLEKKDPVHCYTIPFEGGQEEVALEVKNLPMGWISLGKYRFAAGSAQVILSDRGADQYQVVFADAVKWKKIK